MVDVRLWDRARLPTLIQLAGCDRPMRAPFGLLAPQDVHGSDIPGRWLNLDLSIEDDRLLRFLEAKDARNLQVAGSRRATWFARRQSIVIKDATIEGPYNPIVRPDIPSWHGRPPFPPTVRTKVVPSGKLRTRVYVRVGVEGDGTWRCAEASLDRLERGVHVVPVVADEGLWFLSPSWSRFGSRLRLAAAIVVPVQPMTAADFCGPRIRMVDAASDAAVAPDRASSDIAPDDRTAPAAPDGAAADDADADDADADADDNETDRGHPACDELVIVPTPYGGARRPRDQARARPRPRRRRPRGSDGSRRARAREEKAEAGREAAAGGRASRVRPRRDRARPPDPAAAAAEGPSAPRAGRPGVPRRVRRADRRLAHERAAAVPRRDARGLRRPHPGGPVRDAVPARPGRVGRRVSRQPARAARRGPRRRPRPDRRRGSAGATRRWRRRRRRRWDGHRGRRRAGRAPQTPRAGLGAPDVDAFQVRALPGDPFPRPSSSGEPDRAPFVAAFAALARVEVEAGVGPSDRAACMVHRRPAVITLHFAPPPGAGARSPPRCSSCCHPRDRGGAAARVRPGLHPRRVRRGHRVDGPRGVPRAVLRDQRGGHGPPRPAGARPRDKVRRARLRDGRAAGVRRPAAARDAAAGGRGTPAPVPARSRFFIFSFLLPSFVGRRRGDRTPFRCRSLHLRCGGRSERRHRGARISRTDGGGGTGGGRGRIRRGRTTTTTVGPPGRTATRGRTLRSCATLTNTASAAASRPRGRIVCTPRRKKEGATGRSSISARRRGSTRRSRT